MVEKQMTHRCTHCGYPHDGSEGICPACCWDEEEQAVHLPGFPTVFWQPHIDIIRMRNLEVIGNAHDDKALWEHCHNVAANEELPMNIRLEALKKMNELTGEDDPCDEEALKEYLDCQ